MKNCLVCLIGDDMANLTRVPVNLNGKPWGDMLVCVNCLETLGPEQVKGLVRSALMEKSFKPSQVQLNDEIDFDQGFLGEPAPPERLELPVSAAHLRDAKAFAAALGDRLAAKLWELHRQGASDSLWSTALSPDGEGGYIFSATFAKSRNPAG